MLMDEFSDSTGISITALNQMCDGTYQYPTKGGLPSTVPLTTFVVCGNVDPQELWTP